MNLSTWRYSVHGWLEELLRSRAEHRPYDVDRAILAAEMFERWEGPYVRPGVVFHAQRLLLPLAEEAPCDVCGAPAGAALIEHGLRANVCADHAEHRLVAFPVDGPEP